MKISPVGAEFFHMGEETDGWTEGHTDRHDEANSSFSKLC